MHLQKQEQIQQVIIPYPIHIRPKYQIPKTSKKQRRLSLSRYSSSEEKNGSRKQGNGVENIEEGYEKKMQNRRENNKINKSQLACKTIDYSYIRKCKLKKKDHQSWKSNFKNMMTYFPVYTTLAGNKINFAYLQKKPYLINKNNDGQKTIQKQAKMQKIFSQRRYSKVAPMTKIFKIWKKSENGQNALHFSKRFFSGEKLLIRAFLNSTLDDKNTMISFTSPLCQTEKKVSQNEIKYINKTDLDIAQQLQNEIRYKQCIINNQIKIKRPMKSQLSQTSIGKIIKPFVPPFQKYYYFDFLWKVGFSNKLKIQFVESLHKKYKVYIGQGNNSMLIKTLFKKRESWWTVTDKIQQANLIWTQIKINNIYNIQKNYQIIQQKQPIQQIIIPKNNQIIKITNNQIKKNIKILNQQLVYKWTNYYQKNKYIQQKLPPSFSKRNRIFKIAQLKYINLMETQKIKIHNHLQRNYVLGNKKALFSTMKKYYSIIKQQVFNYLPLTFHIQNGLQDKQYYKFIKYYRKKDKQQKQSQKISKIHNIWIVKPGQFTNRGNGITVCKNLQEIRDILKNKKKIDNINNRTYIVQQYIQKPFLYYKRKFDIRHYMLITCVNGQIKGYWYQYGYIRTTSFQYSLKNNWSSIHLTNDAVQKQLPQYGKYQKGNKLSYEQFEKYLQKQHQGKYSFYNMIYPKMKKIAHDSMRASALLIDEQRKGHNFEIFGFDFMIDETFHPWLIQINTNPCLEISCPVLMDVIKGMLQNALKIGVDSILLPPYLFNEKRPRFNQNVLEQNKFQLLYDSNIQQQQLKKLYLSQQACQLNFQLLEEQQEEVYQDDGIQLDD